MGAHSNSQLSGGEKEAKNEVVLASSYISTPSTSVPTFTAFEPSPPVVLRVIAQKVLVKEDTNVTADIIPWPYGVVGQQCFTSWHSI